MQFEKLPVWQYSGMQNMNWYYNVATNKMPAKYLIAKRIACEIDLKNDFEELVQYHKKLLGKFMKLWNKIRKNEISIEKLPVQTTSLLDLNNAIVNYMLKSCNFCAWNCAVDRTDKGRGICQLGTSSFVSSYFHHFGEELIYRGSNGSGTIFFSSCNMKCVFCQNADISRDKNNGIKINSIELSEMMRLLRLEGVHNINLVGGDPLPHLHTIVNAISKLAVSKFNDPKSKKIMSIKHDYNYSLDKNFADYAGEFNVPILWNSNFYMSDLTFDILSTIIDVWLPDLKYYPDKCARRLSKTPHYFETVSKYIKELYQNNESFSIRHLVMPNHVHCCSIPILNWISKNIPDTPINIMGQYHPDYLANIDSFIYNSNYEDINRRPYQNEIDIVINYAISKNIKYEAVTLF